MEQTPEAQSVGVLPCGHQPLAGVGDTHALGLEQIGSEFLHKRNDESVEVSDFVVEVEDSSGEVFQRSVVAITGSR